MLLSLGDSHSIVKPIQSEGNRYKIQFARDFGFMPDAIATSIDSVIEATDLSENYIVEFVSCDSHEVVHGYEVRVDADINACQGRTQPVACYEVWITLLDADISETAESHTAIPLMKVDSGDSNLMFIALLLAGVIILALIVIFFLKRMASASVDPNSVKIGAFVFNKGKMELTLDNDRIELTGKEADLLKLLSDSANDTVERDDILRSVWGDEGDYVGRTLDVFISKLRKKLEGDVNVRIVNIRGIGYKLISQV